MECEVAASPVSSSLQFSGKRVTVMGLGLFGGGEGVARYLAECGAQLTVTDKRAEKDLQPSLDALKGLPIRYVLGRHDPQDFGAADMIVVNPGVPEEHPLLALAQANGVQIERAINLLFKLTPENPKIGITGSNGKSTTTALLGEMLKLADPRTLVGGNLGGSLLCETRGLASGVPVVLELSSFMLEGMADLRQSPRIAVVMTLSPNHLDRHKTMAAYAAAKQNILRFQHRGDVAILNADDAALRGWEKLTPARLVRFSVRTEPEGDAAFLDGEKLIIRIGDVEEAVASRDSLRLPGLHNASNALAAAAAAIAAGARPWHVAEALATFRGLRHRLELVARRDDGVTFYNDSIATTPESVLCALASFNGPITLIAGGSDKGCSFDELAAVIVHKVRRLILMGVMAPKIEDAVVRAHSRNGWKAGPDILHVSNLDEAVQAAADGAVSNEVVLLSPACASFDMFRNFEERGDLFRSLAQRLAPHRG